MTTNNTIRVKGNNGTLIIHPDRIIIKRGFLSRFMSSAGGESVIHLSKISSVEFKKPRITQGHIRIHGSGLDHNSDRNQCPYTILFNYKKDKFKAAADRINDLIAAR